MYSVFIVLAAIAFFSFVTFYSYKLGKTKTENPRTSAMIGFFLCFFPPFALIYLVVLLLKEDAAIV